MRLRPAAALSLLMLSFAPAAWGQGATPAGPPGEAPAAAPSVKETSQALFKLEEGKRALARGEVDAAITALEAAHAVLRAPTSAVALAKALEKKGRLAGALARYLEATASAHRAKEGFAMAQAFDEAKRAVERLDPRVPAVTVEVLGADAPRLEVDGAPASLDASGKLRVDPGARRVAAAHEERRVEVRVELSEGARETVRIDLRPATGADVAPRAPGEKAAPPTVARPGGAHAHAPRGASAAGLVAVSGFAVAAAGGGVGLGTMLFAGGRRSDVEASCGATCPPSAERELEQVDDLQLVSIVALGVGGAGLVTGVVAAIVGASSSDERASTAPRLALAPGYVGLVGSF